MKGIAEKDLKINTHFCHNYLILKFDIDDLYSQYISIDHSNEE